MAITLSKTEDGSNTAYSTQFEEHYHSIFGAIQESNHVFIEAALHPVLTKKKDISILEIGLGTGLNLLLSIIESEKADATVKYCGLEKFPFPIELAAQLNYPEQLGTIEAAEMLEVIHHSPWNQEVRLSPSFTFEKRQVDFKLFEADNAFDIVYFDAFAPNAQPELWSVDIFQAMYKALKKEGVLVTYCAKGAVKRTMKEVGFIVEALPGPPRKREMTRAVKPN